MMETYLTSEVLAILGLLVFLKLSLNENFNLAAALFSLAILLKVVLVLTL